MLSTPVISTILPVYNGSEYLKQAIESVLGQTFRDFELIIINDGSTDDSLLIASTFKDPRIRVFDQANQGLAATLNRGIGLARGTYVARQDQDDFSLPERFEKQVRFLENNPEVGMVGTRAKILIGDTDTGRRHDHPEDNLTLKFDLLFDNPFVHSSMMIRKSVFDVVGVYTTDRERQPPEDYELWSRIARVFNVANIPDHLHVYREAPQSMSRSGPSPFLDRVVNISAENIAWALGRKRPDQRIVDLSASVHAAYHRISPNPSLSRMKGDASDAARSISRMCGADEESLAERARMMTGPLSLVYAKRTHPFAASVAVSFAKAAARVLNSIIPQR